MSDSITATVEYSELLNSIKHTLASGRLRAARAVNNVIIETYWEIGQDILARQREQGWGARVIERLSADLRTANPGVRGLSVRNLHYMTSLASRWPAGIVQHSAARLPWGQVMVILDSCSDRETSEFYAKRAVEEGWARGVLQAMIANRLHERSQPALTTFDRSLPEADREAVREIVKDPFILDFLMADPVRERDLSKALTDNLSKFLRELGTGFAFVGAEVPVQCGDREFFLDLLFYHCRLHRYVVFELKLGRFEPEYVGKLNFYVQLVDDHLRDQTRDDPTLGMLLVVGRDDVTVEVALRGVGTPLAVSEWRRLPTKVRQALPSAEDLSATMARTVREIESAAPVALCRDRFVGSAGELLTQNIQVAFKRVVAERLGVGEKNLDGQQSGSCVVLHAVPLNRSGPCRTGTIVYLHGCQVISLSEHRVIERVWREPFQVAAHLFPHADQSRVVELSEVGFLAGAHGVCLGGWSWRLVHPAVARHAFRQWRDVGQGCARRIRLEMPLCAVPTTRSAHQPDNKGGRPCPGYAR